MNAPIQRPGASTSSLQQERPSLFKIFDRLGVPSRGKGDRWAASLPFGPGDVTAGSESELQAAVAGERHNVDLPQTIEESGYYANLMAAVQRGERSRRSLAGLTDYLNNNPQGVWENSWVRLETERLNELARRVVALDMQADKNDPLSPQRSDVANFLRTSPSGAPQLRVPISYLIKLALAQALGEAVHSHPQLVETGTSLLQCFLSDNTSPETCSFYVTPLHPARGGRQLARESSKRFLLTHLLLCYANRALGLEESGQQALTYYSPHPPIRQKMLNEDISDAFYRELFMSPCLSGWDEGEVKHEYMHLCHRVLSRSQINAVVRMREAGIITNNLVVLPSLSNLSLANNGIHITLGSRKVSAALRDPLGGLDAADEKCLGDLTTKIIEHFLPLFVGNTSAAPYRLDFQDFHPEKVLGFLPHELTSEHLRILWRRWKKKAGLKVLGQPVTPFGPRWLDGPLSALLGLRGDFVPDMRLLDYLVCVLSTEHSPALDGRLGNHERLKRDLANQGVFDKSMSIYLLHRTREFAKMGFFGFEARHYSLFEDFERDMGLATDLQVLLSALAMKYIARGLITHAHIPDTRFVESERRQIFFSAAVGLKTLYIRKDTPNLLLQRILTRAGQVKPSRRRPAYLKVKLAEYQQALFGVLLEDAADLIEMLGMGPALADLHARLKDPERESAAGRLTQGILDKAGARNAMAMRARDFNLAAERYYHDDLRHKHLGQAVDQLEEDLGEMEQDSHRLEEPLRRAMHELTGQAGQVGPSAASLHGVRQGVLEGTLPPEELHRLILLTLATVRHDQAQANL